MSGPEYPYDEDEFDALGADRTPQGVHRAPVPRWKQVMPFVLVILLAPLLAWAGVSALSGNFASDPEPSPTPTTTEPATQDPDDGNGENGTEGNGENGNGEETEEPTDGETTEEPTDEEVELDQSVGVVILNGARVQGLAGRMQERVNAEGWDNTSVGDYQSAQPTVSTIYYRDAEIEAEAQALAELLGIEPTMELASAAPNGIVIVLRPDFTEP